jgi:hypothetical protein
MRGYRLLSAVFEGEDASCGDILSGLASLASRDGIMPSSPLSTAFISSVAGLGEAKGRKRAKPT